MERPELRKIVLMDVVSDELVDAIRAVVPDVNLVARSDESEVAEEIVDAQVLIGDHISIANLERAEQLFWHHRPWVGVEKILNPMYVEKGVIMTNGSGTNSANIAEHVIGMMLAFAREFPRFFRDKAEKRWRSWDAGDKTIFDLEGQRVLCLGTGAIGQEVARRLVAFGCEMVGASRSGNEAPGFLRTVAIDDMGDELSEADSIVNCLPMTPTTDKIVSREMIARMKKGSRFYNVGRGGTVDQDALIEALQSGHIAAAGLDVMTPEPLNPDSPLWEMDNVIITSHTAGDSPRSHQRMKDLVVEQIRRYQAGEQLMNIVDVSAGY